MKLVVVEERSSSRGEERVKFKALVLEKLNCSPVIQELEVPSLNCGQVLVKVFVSGICGAQLGEISGAGGDDPYLPHLLGHEGGGVIEDVGPGVSYVGVGDRVVMHWRKGVGIEAEPPRYRSKKGFIGAGRITTFNEYAVVSENRLTVVGEDVPFDVAAMMGCCVTTGLGVVSNEAQLRLGETILVIGCGGVGLSVIQGALLSGASKIIAVDKDEAKARSARRFGATHTGCREDWCERFVDKTVDVVVDTTGRPEQIERGLNTVSPGGKMVLVGQPRVEQAVVFSNFRQHFNGKIMLDSQGGLTNPTVDIPRHLSLYKQNKLEIDGLIGGRYSLDEISKAIDDIQQGRVIGRAVIEMGTLDE